MLARRQQEVGSLLCVGLDPQLLHIPYAITAKHNLSEDRIGGFLADPSDPQGKTGRRIASAFEDWMKGVVDATVPYACMFKPQSAFWEAIPGGREAMQRVIRHIHEDYPDIPVFLDCKRGDIGTTQGAYGFAHLKIDDVDGMNFNPYMGRDCVEALAKLNLPGRAFVGLCRTSNPSAWDIQDAFMGDGRRFYEHVAEQSLSWFDKLGVTENAGLVMGAAHKSSDLLLCPHWARSPMATVSEIYDGHFYRVRDIVGGKLWFLIPGVGAQGGFEKATVRAAWTGWGSIAVNSSSAISNASRDDDYAEAAARVAEETNKLLMLGIPA